MDKLLKGAKTQLFISDAERDLFALKYQNNPTKELRDRLIVGSLDIVYEVVTGPEFTFSPLSGQDMLSEGITGLIKAIDTYGTEGQIVYTQMMISKNKVSFTEYASLAIRHAILNA